MRIREIHVDGFGVWNDLNLDQLPADLTVLYGPNEAGKSTLLQFVRTVLYGYSPARRARYVPPVYGGRPGGALALENGQGGFIAQRYALATERDDAPGQLSLLDAEGAPCEPGKLRELLGGVDEATFNHVFAIGLREIQELGTLHDNAAADLLYQLTSGMDRVSLVEVARELADSRTRLWAGEHARSQITEGHERKDRLQAEIDELTARGWKYTDLAEQRELLQDEAEKLDREIERYEEDLELLDAAQRVREPWLARVDIDKQLATFGKIPVVPESAVVRVQALNDRIARMQKLRRAWLKKSKALRAEVDALPMNRLVTTHASRIEALQEHAQWIVTLEGQIERLTDEVRKLDADIQQQVAQLGLPANKGGLNEDAAARMLATLKTPAKTLRTATERYEHARQEAENAKREADRALQSAERAAGRMPMDITAAIQEAGQRVGLLRRRVQLEEQLDQLNRNRDELEDDADFWLARQMMPPWMQFVAGATFVAGAALVMYGIFGGMFDGRIAWANGSALTLIIVGCTLAAGAVMKKIHHEREANLELEECRRQLTVVYRQSAEAKEERDDIDAQLPTGGGALDVRLTSAESELHELERLAPMESLRSASMDRSESLGRRVTESLEGLEEARAQWRGALKSVGLPEDFDPQRVRHIAQQGDDIAEIRRRRDQRREELELRERDLLGLSSRVETLFRDLQLTPEASRPQMQLRQVSNLLLRERETLSQRRETAARLKELRGRYGDGMQRLRKLTRSRVAILTKAGVENEDALRRRVKESAQIRLLRKERERLTSDIQARLNSKYTEDIVSGVLVGGIDRLDARRRDVNQEIQQSRLALAQIHEKRGAYGQEMQLLLADRRLPAAKIELEEVDAQLAEAHDRWRVLTVVEEVLQTQMHAYEREKQPATLREASEYLRELTLGHYRRIWTPLSERTLQIEDDKGQSLPVELLSRGTREAIYLALRMSLVKQYERKGVALPLVLDDVLVNFDAQRVRAAAKLLKEFAVEGRQVLMFTCHEHIMRIFREADVHVRTLPTRQGLDVVAPVVEQRPAPLPPPPPPPPRPIPTPVFVAPVAPPPAPPVLQPVVQPVMRPRVTPPAPLPPLPPPPVLTPVLRVDPPAEKKRRKRKTPVVAYTPPPLPPPPLPPPARIVRPLQPPVPPSRPKFDPNELFSRAAVEEVWYDPIAPLPKREPVPPVETRRVSLAAEPVVLYSQPAEPWAYHVIGPEVASPMTVLSTVMEPPVTSPEPRPTRVEISVDRLPRQRRRRFTWESPEMYQEDEDGDEE